MEEICNSLDEPQSERRTRQDLYEFILECIRPNLDGLLYNRRKYRERSSMGRADIRRFEHLKVVGMSVFWTIASIIFRKKEKKSNR